MDAVVVRAHRRTDGRVDLPAIGHAVQFDGPGVALDHGREFRAALHVVAPDALVRAGRLVPPGGALADQVAAGAVRLEVLHDREPTGAFFDRHDAVVDAALRRAGAGQGPNGGLPFSDPGIELVHLRGNTDACRCRTDLGVGSGTGCGGRGLFRCRAGRCKQEQEARKSQRELHRFLRGEVATAFPPADGAPLVAGATARGDAANVGDARPYVSRRVLPWASSRRAVRGEGSCRRWTWVANRGTRSGVAACSRSGCRGRTA